MEAPPAVTVGDSQMETTNQVAEGTSAERADPFCGDAPGLECLLMQCWQIQAVEGQTSKESCGELRKRILDEDRWDKCELVRLDCWADCTTQECLDNCTKRQESCLDEVRQ